MEDILKVLLTKNNLEAVLAIITVLSFMYIFCSYYYKILNLRRRSELEELRIKQDVIEQVNKEEKNHNEVTNKIINLDISNEIIDMI